MLQIILQILVDELELSLSAVHPDDKEVSEWYVSAVYSFNPTMYSRSQKTGTFPARTHP